LGAQSGGVASLLQDPADLLRALVPPALQRLDLRQERPALAVAREQLVERTVLTPPPQTGGDRLGIVPEELNVDHGERILATRGWYHPRPLMDKLRITGGRRLSGRVPIAGAKNASLPDLAATLLTSEPVELANLPNVRDVRTMLRVLEQL